MDDEQRKLLSKIDKEVSVVLERINFNILRLDRIEKNQERFAQALNKLERVQYIEDRITQLGKNQQAINARIDDLEKLVYRAGGAIAIVSFIIAISLPIVLRLIFA